MLNKLLAPLSKPAMLGIGFLSSAIAGATTAIIFSRKERKVRREMRTRMMAAMLTVSMDGDKAEVRRKLISALQVEVKNESEPLPQDMLEQIKEILKDAYGVSSEDIFERYFASAK